MCIYGEQNRQRGLSGVIKLEFINGLGWREDKNIGLHMTACLRTRAVSVLSNNDELHLLLPFNSSPVCQTTLLPTTTLAP